MRNLATPELGVSHGTNKKKIPFFFIVTIALIYAVVLTYANSDQLDDHSFYVNYATIPAYLIHYYLGNGYISLLFNEPIWLCLNWLLSVFLEPEQIIRSIVFVSAFVTAYVVLSQGARKHFIILLLFLLLPQVIKNNLIQLRQGLAVAIFIAGWYSTRASLRRVTALITPFIHSSFFFILAIAATIKFLSAMRFSGLRISSSIKLISIITICMSMAFLGLTVAAYLGARQGVGYEQWGEDVSGIGFVFWFCMLLNYLAEGEEYLRQNMLSISIIIFYLAAYFVSPISARVFESVLLIILISGLSLTHWRKWCFYSLFVFYFCSQWYSRLGLPLLGWGVHT